MKYFRPTGLVVYLDPVKTAASFVGGHGTGAGDPNIISMNKFKFP